MCELSAVTNLAYIVLLDLQRLQQNHSSAVLFWIRLYSRGMTCLSRFSVAADINVNVFLSRTCDIMCAMDHMVTSPGHFPILQVIQNGAGEGLGKRLLVTSMFSG